MKNLPKNGLMIFCLGSLVYSLIFSPNMAIGMESEQWPVIEWARVYNDDGLSFNHKATSFQEGKKSIVLAGLYNTSEKVLAQQRVDGIWFLEIDDEGKKISSFLIKNVEGTNDYYTNIEALKVSSMGGILIVVQSKQKEATLINFDKKGKRNWAKNLGTGRHVSKIFELDDGSVLLIGHSSFNPMILKFNNTGVLTESKNFPRGKSAFFVDGIRKSNGAFLFLENSGDPQQFYMSNSHIWLSVFNSNMEKLEEQNFLGRNGQIIPGSKNDFFVVYDKSSSAKQKIHLKHLGEKLQEFWDLQVITTEFGLRQFKIGRIEGEGVVVVGSVGGKKYMGIISEDGKLMHEFTEQEAIIESEIDIQGIGKSLFVTSTVALITGQQKLNKQIKIVKFKAP